MSLKNVAPEKPVLIQIDRQILFTLYGFPYLARQHKRGKQIEKCIKIHKRTKSKRIRDKQVKIVMKIIKEETKDYDQMIQRGQAYVTRRAQAEIKNKI